MFDYGFKYINFSSLNEPHSSFRVFSFLSNGSRLKVFEFKIPNLIKPRASVNKL
jgi:hypothetical protein